MVGVRWARGAHATVSHGLTPSHPAGRWATALDWERFAKMTSGDHVDADFLARVPSFSLIYFTGDVYERLPSFLTECGYKILAEGKREDAFFDLIDVIDRVEARTIVSKAAYRVSGGTVLLDPEMVVASVS